MLKYNNAMSDALSRLTPAVNLPADLAAIANAGFYRKEGCALLGSFKYMNTNARLDSFEDRTGYECFINSVHIDDYVEDQWLSTALFFAAQLLESWSGNSQGEKLQVIVSCDESGAVVKAHMLRKGESWISDDVDDYRNPILTATSDESDLRSLIGGTH